MSKQIINEYRAELDRLRVVSGARRESVLREAFKDLLKQWGKKQDLIFIAEHEIFTDHKTRIYLDGALLHTLRVPFGYWEAKDENDDLEKEIDSKFRKGYPKTNTIFSDDYTAILWQDGVEVMRALMDDAETLLPLLTRFFAHERQEVANFKEAVGQFASDLPKVLDALRDIISDKRAVSPDFAKAEQSFLKHARATINPAVNSDDVQEMLIQHILTEEIFAKIFNNPDYHRLNNIASELYNLEDKLFGYGEKARLLRALGPYYAKINSAAAVIESHSEKQGFLKALYENFYKVYNPKAADRLGVIYTPGEIVRFMIRSTDWLCEEHFGLNLIDSGVEILDPATGTGTFIVELLEHFRGNHKKLSHKYADELHANEIGILPYYVANLNIEATYQAITQNFAEFENLCLVDTLDNVNGLGIYAGHQFDMLGSLSDMNIERIKRQNRRKISIIIGNPPYNNNQKNENDNNKNRTYPHVDGRIKSTYIKESSAKKPKAYDMYARFYRWATDRLSDDGIVAFITNRSFISAKTYDGFRKLVLRDFSEAWIYDLGGDWKQKGDGGGSNVFGISTGVAICFLVRKKNSRIGHIHYGAMSNLLPPDGKLSLLAASSIHTVSTSIIKVDAKGNWIDEGNPEFDPLTPVISEKTKKAKTPRQINAIFKNYTNGINTARDSWVYGRDKESILEKINHFKSIYKEHKNGENYDEKIKWSRNLKKKQESGVSDQPLGERFMNVNYRPFKSRILYNSSLLIDEPGLTQTFYPDLRPNPTITISDTSSRASWTSFASSIPIDFHFGSTSDGYKALPRFSYTNSGAKVDNITNWALTHFQKRYGKSSSLNKDVIFYYVYGVLNDPLYREMFKKDLKREYPRIPLHANFKKWAKWGEILMAMHIDYNSVKSWPIERTDVIAKRAENTIPRSRLRSYSDQGVVQVDDDTKIINIPRHIWDYKIGNRSAIDWALDGYKEKNLRAGRLVAEYDTYRFADYKEELIRLIGKIIRVSFDTLAIINEMAALDRLKAD